VKRLGKITNRSGPTRKGPSWEGTHIHLVNDCVIIGSSPPNEPELSIDGNGRVSVASTRHRRQLLNRAGLIVKRIQLITAAITSKPSNIWIVYIAICCVTSSSQVNNTLEQRSCVIANRLGQLRAREAEVEALQSTGFILCGYERCFQQSCTNAVD